VVWLPEPPELPVEPLAVVPVELLFVVFVEPVFEMLDEAPPPPPSPPQSPTGGRDKPGSVRPGATRCSSRSRLRFKCFMFRAFLFVVCTLPHFPDAMLYGSRQQRYGRVKIRFRIGNGKMGETLKHHWQKTQSSAQNNPRLRAGLVSKRTHLWSFSVCVIEIEEGRRDFRQPSLHGE
jgi:hypothetical protein